MTPPTQPAMLALEDALKVVTSGVAIQDATGANVCANAMAAHLVGLNVDQLRGRTAHDALWQATRADGTALPPDEHPGPVASRTGQPLRGMVMSVVGADGGRHWLEVDAEPLFVDGRVHCVVIIYRDITRRRQAEEAPRASAPQLRSHSDQAPSAVALGEAAVTSGLAPRDPRAFLRPAPRRASETLTAREQDVLALLVQGVTSTRELAARLVVSENTVKYHIRNILRKLHLQNRAQVVGYTLRHGR